LDVTTNINAATLSTSGLATLNTVAITNSLDVAGHQSKTQQNLQRQLTGPLSLGAGVAKNLNVGARNGCYKPVTW
jgi:hypothetical protein